LLSLNEYQERAGTTAIYGEGIDHALHDVSLTEWEQYLRLSYCIMKLNGEAGECAEIVAKRLRDYSGQPILDDVTREVLAKELGDVLWYVANAAEELGYYLDNLAQLNLDKLARRKKENKLHGSGSDR
jgi:NTP pyrophosphatase (non-canonical NTP hydrolase)